MTSLPHHVAGGFLRSDNSDAHGLVFWNGDRPAVLDEHVKVQINFSAPMNHEEDDEPTTWCLLGGRVSAIRGRRHVFVVAGPTTLNAPQFMERDWMVHLRFDEAYDHPWIVVGLEPVGIGALREAVVSNDETAGDIYSDDETPAWLALAVDSSAHMLDVLRGLPGLSPEETNMMCAMAGSVMAEVALRELADQHAWDAGEREQLHKIACAYEPLLREIGNNTLGRAARTRHGTVRNGHESEDQPPPRRRRERR